MHFQKHQAEYEKQMLEIVRKKKIKVFDGFFFSDKA